MRLNLLPGEKVEADLGYKGNPVTVALPNQYSTVLEYYTKKQVRCRHEIVNGYLKHFGCLMYPFRHELLRHKIVFEAVVVVVQIGLQLNPPFTKIDYKFT